MGQINTEGVQKGKKLSVIVDFLDKNELMDLANKLYTNNKADVGEILYWPYGFKPAYTSVNSSLVFKLGGKTPSESEIDFETTNVSHNARFYIGVYGLWTAPIEWKGDEVKFNENYNQINTYETHERKNTVKNSPCR